jgi:hypothetical protein
MNIRNDRFLYQYLFIRKGVKLIDEEIMKNQQKKKKMTIINERILHAFTKMLLSLFLFPISANFRKDKHIFS